MSNKPTNYDVIQDQTPLDQKEPPTAALNLNSQKISNLSDPAAPQDAATRSFVLSSTMKLTQWTVATRPTPAPGEILIGFNTDPEYMTLEIWNGSEWIAK